MAGILLDQGTELKFDEWRMTSDTPVVAATLALQQAETIFYMDMDIVLVEGCVEPVHAVS